MPLPPRFQHLPRLASDLQASSRPTTRSRAMHEYHRQSLVECHWSTMGPSQVPKACASCNATADAPRLIRACRPMLVCLPLSINSPRSRDLVRRTDPICLIPSLRLHHHRWRRNNYRTRQGRSPRRRSTLDKDPACLAVPLLQASHEQTGSRISLSLFLCLQHVSQRH